MSGKAIFISHLNWEQNKKWASEECIAYLSSNRANQPSDFVYVNLCPTPVWSNNMVTLAVLILSNLFFHELIVILSNFKSTNYMSRYVFKDDDHQETETRKSNASRPFIKEDQS
mmetsp:Transcript_31569/g.30888  ORF Transcript_31569/g.30888 Transcript_31569/m.30888 type:complete len:114 (+) Transcript_31569:574-915(+)